METRGGKTTPLQTNEMGAILLTRNEDWSAPQERREDQII